MRRAVGMAVGVALMVLPVEELGPQGPAVHGRPGAAAAWALDQPARGLCGPTSVAMVVGQLKGRPVGRREVSWTAERMGLLDYPMDRGVVGMRRSSLTDLFAAFGVPAEPVRTTVNGLRALLDEGRAIVLHVDSAELWGRGDGDADHFVVLTGIDDRHEIARINDPGMGPAYGFAQGTGAAHAVSLAALDDAWHDSGRWAMVTEAVPGLRPA
jgi:hypothetical protein